MNIETGDLVFYVYEFVVICGLVFRIYLEFEDKPYPRPEVEILTTPRPPQPIVTVPVVEEEVPIPILPRKHPVTKKEYIDFFKEVLTWCQQNIKLGKDRKIRPRFIHEYVHHLQIRSAKDNVRYNTLTRRKGYIDNDFEREARNLSSFYLNECCKYLNL